MIKDRIKPLVKPRGVPFSELSNAECKEIISQYPKIAYDPSLHYYKFYKNQFGVWMIPNILSTPLGKKGVFNVR